jgi:hypothetical protein
MDCRYAAAAKDEAKISSCAAAIRSHRLAEETDGQKQFMIITSAELPDLVDAHSQRLELLAILLPRLGGVVGHEHQPLALKKAYQQQLQ